MHETDPPLTGAKNCVRLSHRRNFAPRNATRTHPHSASFNSARPSRHEKHTRTHLRSRKLSCIDNHVRTCIEKTTSTTLLRSSQGTTKSSLREQVFASLSNQPSRKTPSNTTPTPMSRPNKMEQRPPTTFHYEEPLRLRGHLVASPNNRNIGTTSPTTYDGLNDVSPLRFWENDALHNPVILTHK